MSLSVVVFEFRRWQIDKLCRFRARHYQWRVTVVGRGTRLIVDSDVARGGGGGGGGRRGAAVGRAIQFQIARQRRNIVVESQLGRGANDVVARQRCAVFLASRVTRLAAASQ